MSNLHLTIPDWRDFQHYKNRTPPWIKLHRNLILDNYDWHRLPLASKALAPSLWLLASESEDGSIRCDSTSLAFRLRVSEQELFQAIIPLVSLGFLIDASMTLAQCEQLAIPEERESKSQSQIPHQLENRILL